MSGDLGKLIAAKGLKKLPKVQKIARSGHTDGQPQKFQFQIIQCYAKKPKETTFKPSL